MKKAINPFDYPVVIKQVNEYITVSVPDLDIVVAEGLPGGFTLNRAYVASINQLVLSAAAKAAKRLETLGEAKVSIKKAPSKIKQTITINEDEWLTTNQVAKEFGVTPRTIRRWESSGKIKAKKSMGGHRKFLYLEIKELLQKN
jgi:excisionase family DNA binding protein